MNCFFVLLATSVLFQSLPLAIFSCKLEAATTEKLSCYVVLLCGAAANHRNALQAVGRRGLAELACRGALVSSGSHFGAQAARSAASFASTSLRQAGSCTATSRTVAWRAPPSVRRLCTATAGSLRADATVTPSFCRCAAA